MSQRGFIARVFSFLGRAIDGLRVFFARLIFVLILLVVLTLLFSGPVQIGVADGTLVVLAPKGAIVEEPPLMDTSTLLLGGDQIVDTPLRDVLRTLTLAATDDRVRGVVLDLEELESVSPANMELIGDALISFKRSGKALLAHSDYFSQAQYYLASFADSLSLHPMGQLMLPGYGGSQPFYAELLAKLGVNVHIFRVGTHKAAVEPYSLNGMSDESRANSQQLVDELWQRYLNQIAVNRDLSEAAVRRYANDYADLLVDAGGDTAGLALSQGMVDSLETPAQWREQLRRLSASADGSPNTLSHRLYLMANPDLSLPTDSEVGVIVAQGEIGLGEQPRGSIGADSLNALIREAREDARIKAVVLRIDSPGGSAFASELIRQELQELQAAGKPFVVSMGGTAASGGYWIAAGADEIWASPATVTGSIGVFSMVPTFEDSLAKVGVYADGISTTPYSRADLLSPLSEPFQRVLQTSVEAQYQRFLQLVSDGRGMSLEAVDAVAQGQVRSGTQALSDGLVDKLGSLEDAIAAAAQLAGLTDYGWRYVETPLSPGEQLLEELLRNYGSSVWLSGPLQAVASGIERITPAPPALPLVSKAFGAWQAFAHVQDPGHLYVRCELCVMLP